MIRLLQRALLCALAAVPCLSAPAGAAEVRGLYEARVPVAGQGAGERRAAIRSAFEEVLVKVTGDRRAPSLSGLEAALERPMRFVQQFRYRPLERPPSNGQDAGPEYTQAIRVSFDRQAVNRLLQGAAVPVWGRTRPTTLLWFAVEERGERYLVGSDTRPGLVREIRDAAERRGLPLLLPLLDLVDQRRIRFTDVWGNFEDTVLEASARYETGAVLVGRLYRASGGEWSARWSLYQDGRAEHWRSEAARHAGVVTAGIGGAADLLGQRYAQLLGTEDGRAVDVVVTDIADVDDYARASGYLRRLDPVSEVRVATVEPQQIRFRVFVQGDRDGLARTIGLGDMLAPVAGETAAGRGERLSGIQELSYRLLP